MCSIQAGVKSCKTAECPVRLASCASSCAAPLLSLFAWTTVHSGNRSPDSIASSVMNCRFARLIFFCSTFTTTLQSISKITFCGVYSAASSSPSLAASASTTSASPPRGTWLHAERSRFPEEFRITTPIPPSPVFVSKAPSTFTLIHPGFGLLHFSGLETRLD
ncbi:unnamed protein product [Urochloa humidicola]